MTTDAKPSGLIDRTLLQIRNAWREIAEKARILTNDSVRPDLPEGDVERIRKHMADCLGARGGEVSARARAADLGRIYLTLEEEGRARFLRLLAHAFATDHATVDAAVTAFVEAPDDAARIRAEAELRRALVAPRIYLLRQFSSLPNGVKFLVDLRADLLRLGKDDPALAALEAELKDLLAAWFDVGLLELVRIDWNAPAALLEKLIAYEAVHEIRSWRDLKNRLRKDRRCFAFIHPKMPDEPLIFVEVALLDRLADSIQALLDESAPPRNPAAADTAVFYSISNAQIGLSGISFGGFLIKRVVDELTREFKDLDTFATLSPIPGFRAWLDERIAAGDEGVLTGVEARHLAALADTTDGPAALRALLDDPWYEDPERTDALRRPLMRLCAGYLLVEKRKGRPLDPVARFHLRNGAGIERINWLADVSEKGLRQSAGMMVNYLYRLDEIEANHEAYTGEGRITAATSVNGLLRGYKPANKEIR